RFVHEWIAAAGPEQDAARWKEAAGVAASRVLREFAPNQSREKSLHEATLCQTLGGVFWQLRDLESAERMLRKAREWRVAYLTNSIPGGLSLVSETLYSLAVVLRARGRDGEAEKLLHETLSLTNPALGDRGLNPSDPLVVDILHLLALVYSDRKAWVEADTRYREALALAQRIEPEGGRRTVRSLRSLAALFTRLGQGPAAERLLQQADEMALHLPPENEADHTPFQPE
ncbi:MAG: tetratricopeptide repeat protein, partial [Verrucomicrobiota bacterium]